MNETRGNNSLPIIIFSDEVIPNKVIHSYNNTFSEQCISVLVNLHKRRKQLYWYHSLLSTGWLKQIVV